MRQSHISIIGFHVQSQPGSRFVSHRVEIATIDKKTVQKLVVKVKDIKGVRQISHKLI